MVWAYLTRFSRLFEGTEMYNMACMASRKFFRLEPWLIQYNYKQDKLYDYLRYAFGLRPNDSAFSSVIRRHADAPSVYKQIHRFLLNEGCFTD